ncbi:MAG: peptide chain release factor N(5)-glutamine methyltransferase [Spirosomataceae bacterium]
MRTLQEIYNTLQAAISIQDIPEKKAIATVLIEHFLGASKLDILGDKPWDDTHIHWQSIIERINLHEPLQYILGETNFYGITFITASGVLIPRPETEELVDILIQKFKASAPTILDIGTGSGCIAITLAKKIPSSSVTAWDISVDALRIAQKNAEKHQIAVQFEQKDVLHLEEVHNPKFDLIVSNPPYICQSERINMQENVLQYEPSLALFVPDDDPLLFYRKIAELGINTLKPGALLAFEVNRAYGEETKKMLLQMGYENCILQKDISQNNRFVFGNCPYKMQYK